MLELVQSLYTNGARAASLFSMEASHFLAIPQLAADVPGADADMHGGNSDIPMILYRTDDDETLRFSEFQQLDVPGGEDAEFFTLNDRSFLATTSRRSGSDPNYEMNVDSIIFEWDGEKMAEFQHLPTWGAKQWHSFDLSGRHFLALAQGQGGLTDEKPTANITTNSTIFEWNGDKFEPFQTLPSENGYNWLHFSLDGREFLAYADNTELSAVFEWNGDEFATFQSLDGLGGRAFSLFENSQSTFLAFSRIESDSLVYQWDGTSFQHHQTLEGAGGREFALVKEEGASSFLFHAKFLTNGVNGPDPAISSVIYRVTETGLEVTGDIPTFGCTDISTFSVGKDTYIATAESFSEDLRFRQDSHVYRFISDTQANETKTSTSTDLPARKKRQEDDDAYVSPEFMELFNAYTRGRNSIGEQFRNISTEKQASNPLIIATSDGIVLYPGDDSDPVYLNYRYGSAAFIELTSVSHLGPAVASLPEIRAANPECDDWRQYAELLLEASKGARSANSESLWSEKLGVDVHRGREGAIASMVSYACDLTIRFLETVLADPEKLTAEFVRENYLSGAGDELGASIPMNYVMAATFFLSAIDNAMQTHNVLEPQDIDWKNVMVLITGQTGRETAGVVLSSNTVAQMFLKSNPDLSAERIYIAPHGLVPNMTDSSPDALRKFEPELRNLWGKTRAYVDLARQMFTEYPAYKVADDVYPEIDENTESVSELPAVTSPDDWLALSTRLRVTLEDPRQLLSGSITDYATQQMFEAGWDVSKLVVPGLDGYDYDSALTVPSV